MNRDPYQAYAQNGLIGSSPVELVVAMYETAIKRTREARLCLEAGDVWGRTQAISKAGMILTELITSLNPDVGTEIGRNLDRLYHYMQRRLQEAHLRKTTEPLTEVEGLLNQLLGAWYEVAAREREGSAPVTEATQRNLEKSSSPYECNECSEAAYGRVAVSV